MTSELFGYGGGFVSNPPTLPKASRGYVQNSGYNVYTWVRSRNPKIRGVGSREFRENFSSFLNASDAVAITCNGQTVGFYVPVRPHKANAELAALQTAATQIADLLKS